MRTEAAGQARGVALLGGSAMILRVFALMAIDQPGAYSASWLSALAGAGLSLPVWLLLCRGPGKELPGRTRLEGTPRGRAACAALAALTVYDAAVSARLFAALVGYAALNDHSVTALSMPLLASALAVCLMGTGALSASAVIWRRAALALAALVLLLQLGEMRPGWLLPPLGPGGPDILRCALRPAGCMTMAALGMYLLDGETPKRLPAALARSAGLCTAALLLFGMLIPAMPGLPTGRLIRIELLLDSGRNGLAAEMIFVLMMFGGLLITGFELMTAASALSVAAPRLKLPACVILCGAAAAALALSALTAEQAAQDAARFYYPAALVSAALMTAPVKRRNAP